MAGTKISAAVAIPGAVTDTVPTSKKLVRPAVKSKTDQEDTDFTIKKPAYQYKLNRGAQVAGEKFHSTRRAWMLSAVLPGAGQIYNKRYWKLPIVYGGFVGLALVINFNQKQYNTTLQYYKLKLNNPTSPLLPVAYQMAPVTEIASIKEYYRRNRDLGVIGSAALLVAGIVDAFVDSELKGFDVSNKLSMQVKPLVQPDLNFNGNNTLQYGVSVALSIKHLPK